MILLDTDFRFPIRLSSTFVLHMQSQISVMSPGMPKRKNPATSGPQTPAKQDSGQP